MKEPIARPRILCVDVETTGLDANRHSILQIGAEWIAGPRDGQTFAGSCRMFPGAVWTPEAAAVNGITQAAAEDPSLDSETDLVLRFITWIGDAPMMAGLNPSFDRACIHSALRRASAGGMRTPAFFPHRTLDLHSLAVGYALKAGELVPSRGLYTDEIFHVLDLPTEPRPHVAINGARNSAAAFRKILDLPAPQ